MRFRSVLVIAVLVAGGITPQETWAQSSEYSLDSIGLGSTDVVEPGEEYVALYSVSHPEAAAYSHFVFTDGRGRKIWITGDDGQASYVIGPYEPAGILVLRSIHIYWNDQDHIYRRNGTLRVIKDGFETQASHTLDFSVVDYTIVNPDEDFTTPYLDGFSALKRTRVQPGDVVRIRYSAGDADSGLLWGAFAYRGPDDRLYFLEDADYQLSPTGVAYARVKRSWPKGNYRLIFVEVGDRVPIWARYQRDGSVTKYPEWVESPTGHQLDLAVNDLKVVRG